MKHRKLIFIVTGLLGLFAVVAVFDRNSKSVRRSADGTVGEISGSKAGPEHETTAARDNQPSDEQPARTTTGTQGTSKRHDSKEGEVGPAVTKAALRDSVATPGGRKVVIDPMASWDEVPAWPEGPRLYAEVETKGKRYVNLRPNDIGLLPLLRVEPKEPLEITLQLPESSPGDSIHIELPNGGRFPDESAMGRVIRVEEDRTVRFQVEADDSRGNCTVHVRQAGHTRTLPLWIGEPPSMASGDDP